MKNNLHELILSMSKNEKRYFKIESGVYGSGNKDYLMIYEILEKQKQYDPKKYKQQLRSAGFKRFGQLAVIQNYLYEFILKTLVKYKNSMKSIHQVNRLLEQVDLLYDRGLTKQAKKKLNQAKKIAVHYQLKAQTMDILDWEMEFLLLEDTFKKSLNYANEIRALTELNKELIQQDIKHQQNYFNTYLYIYKHGHIKNKEELKNMYDHLDIGKIVEPKLSNQAILHNAYVMSTYYYFAGDLDNALKYSKIRYDTFNNEKQKIINESHVFIKVLYNYIQVVISMKNPDYDLALKLIEEACQVENIEGVDVSVRSAKLVFFLKYIHGIKILMNMGNFPAALALGEELIIDLEKETKKHLLNENFHFVYIKLAYSAFLEREFEKALLWLLKVINSSEFQIRHDLLSFARLLNVMVHIELKNYLLLPSIIDGMQRYFQDHNQYTEFEMIVFPMLRFAVKHVNEPVKVREKLTKVIQEINDLSEKITILPGYIKPYYFVEWLESKCYQTNYKALVMAQISS